jgi:dihydrofolate synthase/folylpolyglutamate synthase
MDYIESLRYLKRRDDWERTGSASDAERWDLRRMRSLLARLGDPHVGRGTVHIAGSRGKGSTAAMVASVLRAAGHTTGLYTSPHLHRFVERIAIDGEPLSEDDFARLARELAPHLEAEDADGTYGTVSTFEALTALAFMSFREHAAAWQVIEVGLGGRLDATNVFAETAVCVITPIGLEHTEILGDTVAKIAGEKAGIITPGTTVIMGPQRESAADVIRDVCHERGAKLIEVARACSMTRGKHSLDGQEFRLQTPYARYKLNIPFLGWHQLENAATAILALEALEKAGVHIDEKTLRDGLAASRWPCRIEVLRRHPLVVADGAHDRDSARRLVQTLRDDLGLRNVTFVVGCSRDKDIELLAEELTASAGQVVATRSRNLRSMPAREIVDAFTHRGVGVMVQEPASLAVDAALAEAGQAIVVCGSLFVAAEAREHVLGVAYDPSLDLQGARA